ncbi:MAG: IspD/TarI family cytidylyltransferase [Streptosporangiales bacterium]
MAVDIPTAAAVVLAGGTGSRFGAGRNKVYLPLAGKRVISWSLLAMARVTEVGRLVLTVRPEDRELAAEIIDDELPGVPVEVIDGGGSRHDSERCALAHLAPAVRAGEVDVIAIHDGARPLVTPSLVRGVLQAARAGDAVLPGIPAHDLVRVDADGAVVDGDGLDAAVRAQTPQAAPAGALIAAYDAAAAAGFDGSDTAACVESFGGVAVRWIRGEARNIKLTYAQDLVLAEQILAADYAGGSGPSVMEVRAEGSR